MASKAHRWNEDDSPLASFHGGTKKAAIRAINEAKLRTAKESATKAFAERKDRVRRRALGQLAERGVRVLDSDVIAPFLPDLTESFRAKSGLTPAHLTIWKRCGGICHYCGEPMMRMPNERRSFTLDHVVPRSRGGTNHLSNLVGSCAECNNDKGSLTGDEYAAVLAVRKRNA